MYCACVFVCVYRPMEVKKMHQYWGHYIAAKGDLLRAINVSIIDDPALQREFSQIDTILKGIPLPQVSS